jgi:hypothetical protein
VRRGATVIVPGYQMSEAGVPARFVEDDLTDLRRVAGPFDVLLDDLGPADLHRCVAQVVPLARPGVAAQLEVSEGMHHVSQLNVEALAGTRAALDVSAASLTSGARAVSKRSQRSRGDRPGPRSS